jgi:hypothetical protein
LQPLSTATLQQTTPLRDLYKATSPSEVDWLTHVTVPFDDGKAILKIQNVYLVPGERVRFDTSSQDVSVVVTADGVTLSGQKSSNGRRLLGSDDSTGTGTFPIQDYWYGTGYDGTGYDGTGYDGTGYDGTGYDVPGYDVPGYDVFLRNCVLDCMDKESSTDKICDDDDSCMREICTMQCIPDGEF